MTRPARTRYVLAALSFGAGFVGACVLPDKGIDVEEDLIANRQAVRFAPSTLLSSQADAECLKSPELDPEMDEGCPQPVNDPSDVLAPFLDPGYVESGTRPYDFCSCDPGERDQNALPRFTLYVEDRDENTRDRTPKDDIYAALLLDLDPNSTEPYLALGYSSYLDTNQPLKLVPADFEYKPLLRPDPHLRELTLGDETQRLDLCNRAGGDPLARGYHTLRIIVSDRAWFQRTTTNGQKLTQTGVPDLASGATFDVVTYVFHCDKKDEDIEGTAYNEAHCVTQCIGNDEEDL